MTSSTKPKYGLYQKVVREGVIYSIEDIDDKNKLYCLYEVNGDGVLNDVKEDEIEPWDGGESEIYQSRDLLSFFLNECPDGFEWSQTIDEENENTATITNVTTMCQYKIKIERIG